MPASIRPALAPPRASSPDDALAALVDGNARFLRGELPRVLSSDERAALTRGQTPFAALLGCADSRAPAEVLFDQRPGDLFNVRLAGNVASPEAIGSLEFAVAALGVPLVVVMGHEGCGAVAAARRAPETLAGWPMALRALVARIEPAMVGLPDGSDDPDRDAVVANVRHQMRQLEGDSAVLAEAVAAGRLRIAGAYYAIGTGRIAFLDGEAGRTSG